MQFAHNGYYKGSIPFGLMDIWSSLVYGPRFENEYLLKVVGSNPTVSVMSIVKRYNFYFPNRYYQFDSDYSYFTILYFIYGGVLLSIDKLLIFFCILTKLLYKKYVK